MAWYLKVQEAVVETVYSLMVGLLYVNVWKEWPAEGAQGGKE